MIGLGSKFTRLSVRSFFLEGLSFDRIEIIQKADSPMRIGTWESVCTGHPMLFFIYILLFGYCGRPAFLAFIFYICFFFFCYFCIVSNYFVNLLALFLLVRKGLVKNTISMHGIGHLRRVYNRRNFHLGESRTKCNARFSILTICECGTSGFSLSAYIFYFLS